MAVIIAFVKIVLPAYPGHPGLDRLLVFRDHIRFASYSNALQHLIPLHNIRLILFTHCLASSVFVNIQVLFADTFFSPAYILFWIYKKDRSCMHTPSRSEWSMPNCHFPFSCQNSYIVFLPFFHLEKSAAIVPDKLALSYPVYFVVFLVPVSALAPPPFRYASFLYLFLWN
jgi:hypothetical protein